MSVATKCSQCGASIDFGALSCKYCGEAVPQQQTPPQQPPQQPQYAQPPQYVQQPQYAQPQQAPYFQQPMSPIDPSWPIKSKVTAGILGILLGGIGIHKFYMGKVGLGIVYLLFCWTYVPALIGFIEGIVYLTSSDHNFQMKHRVRIQ